MSDRIAAFGATTFYKNAHDVLTLELANNSFGCLNVVSFPVYGEYIKTAKKIGQERNPEERFFCNPVQMFGTVVYVEKYRIQNAVMIADQDHGACSPLFLIGNYARQKK